MFDPIGSWASWNRMALAMMTNGTMISEAWEASGRVIDHRMGLFHADAGSAAARGELMRMMPEKMSAFGRSGMAAMSGWWMWQGEMLRLGQEATNVMLKMQPPTLRAAQTSMARSRRAAGRMTRATTAMIAPVHQAVTANDRRLNGAD